MPKAHLSQPWSYSGRSIVLAPGCASAVSRLASVQPQPAGPSCPVGPACPRRWSVPSLGRPSEQARLGPERKHPSRKSRPSPSPGNPSAWNPTAACGGPSHHPTNRSRGRTTRSRNSSLCPGSGSSSTTRRSPLASLSIDLAPRGKAETRPSLPTVAGRPAAPWRAGAHDPRVGLPPAEYPRPRKATRHPSLGPAWGEEEPWRPLPQPQALA